MATSGDVIIVSDYLSTVVYKAHRWPTFVTLSDQLITCLTLPCFVRPLVDKGLSTDCVGSYGRPCGEGRSVATCPYAFIAINIVLDGVPKLYSYNGASVDSSINMEVQGVFDNNVDSPTLTTLKYIYVCCNVTLQSLHDVLCRDSLSTSSSDFTLAHSGNNNVGWLVD